MTKNGLPPLDGANVLVYSLGIEGRDLARWLIAQGARVTVSDTRTDEQLRDAGATVPDGTERVVTGRDLLDPEGFDLLAVSQSILRHSPQLQRARQLGIPVTSQMRLFMQLCPGRMVGITGSAGKTTTTALVAAMADAAGIDYVVGGNIGQALLERLADIQQTTMVVLEISHTQLQYIDRSPAIAAITNVTPNHLDQFSWDEYVGLKRNLLEHQGPDDIAVLNINDRTSHGLMVSVRGHLHRCSTREPIEGHGAFLSYDEVVCVHGKRMVTIANRRDVRLRGEHNIANVVMASAIGCAMGLEPGAMQDAIARFSGVPHRLEIVGTVNQVTWVNDSIATAPERTIAGLRAFAEPVVLLLGGREKNLPLDSLYEEVKRRCRAVVCFGESREVFSEALEGSGVLTSQTATMDDAIQEAAALAKPGDVVLLAPAGTSFDAYPSFEARGQAFREAVQQLPGFREEGR
jgi:UDP-N-acetylmuramoylalanine--D-glutamate ligase